MSNLEDHCIHTLNLYKVDGRDIHQWLDNPVKVEGITHRQFRHDTESIKLAGVVFGEKYGIALAESIALDHIMLDHKNDLALRHTKVINSTKIESDEIKVEPKLPSNSIMLFLHEQCVYDKKQVYSRKELYTFYKKYCITFNLRVEHEKLFTKEVQNLPYIREGRIRDKKMLIKTWVGLRIID